MTHLRCCGSVLLVVMSCFAFGQDTPGGWLTHRLDQEVIVPQLAALKARSHDLSDVLLTSLDIVFHDPEICCDKDSALGDRAPSADPLSVKEIASKVQGTQRLSDGRTITVMADLPPAAPSVDISWWIIGSLRGQHSLLLVRDSHLYVLYGAVFNEVVSEDGSRAFMIHKLLLLDTRYSDGRRDVTFNRDTDDWREVQGMLKLTVTAQ
jgi:hypothetical protein